LSVGIEDTGLARFFGLELRWGGKDEVYFPDEVDDKFPHGIISELTQNHLSDRNIYFLVLVLNVYVCIHIRT